MSDCKNGERPGSVTEFDPTLSPRTVHFPHTYTPKYTPATEYVLDERSPASGLDKSGLETKGWGDRAETHRSGPARHPRRPPRAATRLRVLYKNYMLGEATAAKVFATDALAAPLRTRECLTSRMAHPTV